MNKQFDHQLRKAVNKYGEHHIDIIVEDDEFYGIYHSRNNSFEVTGIYDLNEEGGIKSLKNYELEFEEISILSD